MAYKLIVSDEVQYTARFIFNESGKERVFAAKVKANRCHDLDAAMEKKPAFAEFLKAQGLTLLAWDGECPLTDEAGNDAPANAEALAVLMAFPGMSNAQFLSYIEATGVKAKLGN